ncbi:MAG: hypothetical protein NTV68_06590 [Methanomicrobiales archaeon]|nr:hypothetical protein [Methanomicrobiales archaeon]
MVTKKKTGREDKDAGTSRSGRSVRDDAEEQLNKTVDEIRRFNNLTLDRELRMIALKQEINAC